MNTLVGFELAKLLKDKGFNLKVINFYNYERLSLVSDKDRQIEGLVNYNPINWNSIKDHYTSAPTIAEVVMWLYEKYGVWISVIDVSPSHILWEYQISRKEVGLIYSSGQYPVKHNYSPTEAYEAAILYVLNNLI